MSLYWPVMLGVGVVLTMFAIVAVAAVVSGRR